MNRPLKRLLRQLKIGENLKSLLAETIDRESGFYEF